MRVISVVSGGMDSVAMMYWLKSQGHAQTILSFDYGQRHSIELLSASRNANQIGAPHYVLNLRPTGRLAMAASVLTGSDAEVPEGHYADENMKSTVVPNRNMIMLSIAAAMAISRKADAIATAVHAGDHAIYPDCRPEFIESLESTLLLANEGFIAPDFKVLAPFIDKTKTDIVKIGDSVQTPFINTWSCYKGGDIHCGRCATCIERREAFAQASVADPTVYEVDFNTSMRIGKINMDSAN